MSGPLYEPGTVADAEVRGQRSYRIMRNSEGYWVSAARVGETHIHSDSVVTDVRPLVVLDLHVARAQEFAVWLRNQSKAHDSLLEQVADQIEEQTRPPKPETVSAHDGCRDEGWTEVDGLLYCNACGFSEVSRFIKGGGAA